MQTRELNGHTMEFIPEIHKYIVDGIITPSVSSILAYRFQPYVNVPQDILMRAAQKGTELHKAIEDYEQQGIPSELKEFKNYLILKEEIGFENIENELPVLYEENGRVLYTGTLDQLIEIDGKLGINDFKRVCSPIKEKITLQVNLYRLAYQQTYGRPIEFLSFTHLREDKKKFHHLPIDEEKALNLLYEYYKENYNED